MTRTQDEIIARIEAVKSDDMWGFRREVLVDALDYQHAKPYITFDATEQDWFKRTMNIGGLEQAARDYLAFAIGKIEDHRGMSASRSVDKLGEFAWLMGRDDVVEAMDTADYPQYGAPKVNAFAVGMGWDIPKGDEFHRMTLGLPCVQGCDDGCDQ